MKQLIKIVHEKFQVCEVTFGTRSNLHNHNKSTYLSKV